MGRPPCHLGSAQILTGHPDANLAGSFEVAESTLGRDMTEAGLVSDFPSGQAGTGLDNVKALIRLSPAPTGVGHFHGSRMASPRVGRPGDRNHTGLHIRAADPHLWQ